MAASDQSKSGIASLSEPNRRIVLENNQLTQSLVQKIKSRVELYHELGLNIAELRKNIREASKHVTDAKQHCELGFSVDPSGPLRVLVTDEFQKSIQSYNDAQASLTLAMKDVDSLNAKQNGYAAEIERWIVKLARLNPQCCRDCGLIGGHLDGKYQCKRTKYVRHNMIFNCAIGVVISLTKSI